MKNLHTNENRLIIDDPMTTGISSWHVITQITHSHVLAFAVARRRFGDSVVGHMVV